MRCVRAVHRTCMEISYSFYLAKNYTQSHSVTKLKLVVLSQDLVKNFEVE